MVHGRCVAALRLSMNRTSQCYHHLHLHVSVVVTSATSIQANGKTLQAIMLRTFQKSSNFSYATCSLTPKDHNGIAQLSSGTTSCFKGLHTECSAWTSPSIILTAVWITYCGLMKKKKILIIFHMEEKYSGGMGWDALGIVLGSCEDWWYCEFWWEHKGDCVC